MTPSDIIAFLLEVKAKPLKRKFALSRAWLRRAAARWRGASGPHSVLLVLVR